MSLITTRSDLSLLCCHWHIRTSSGRKSSCLILRFTDQVFPSPMFRGIANRFLGKMISDAKIGGSILSYMTVDRGAIFDKEWTGHRMHSFFHTKTTFP